MNTPQAAPAPSLVLQPSAQPAAERSAPIAAPGHQQLIAMLLAEIEATAVFVAVSASIANACLVPLEDLDPLTIIDYLPAEPVLAGPALPALLATADDCDAITLLRAFQMRLSFARRLSTAFAAGRFASPAARGIHAETLADAWQRTSASAHQSIQSLRRLLPITARGRSVIGGSRVLDLLRLTQHGEHPCVEPDGLVVVPGWAERRKARRSRLGLACMARVAGRIMPATIHDISIGGMGLHGVTQVDRGAPIDVELPTGRRLSGTIAWHADANIGVKFATPLSARDPLLPQSADGGFGES